MYIVNGLNMYAVFIQKHIVVGYVIGFNYIYIYIYIYICTIATITNNLVLLISSTSVFSLELCEGIDEARGLTWVCGT